MRVLAVLDEDHVGFMPMGHACLVGTDAWVNWRAFNDGAKERENFDDEIQSDAEFSGGCATFGPYQLSTVIRRPGHVGPAVIIHGGIHKYLIPNVVVDGKLAPADSKSYHGGTMSDEIAALVSLALGVRCRVGGTIRLSGLHDQVGRPPIYLEVPRQARPGPAGRELIPRAMSRPADIGGLARLESFPVLSEDDEVELVRAARAYSGGLWWANEDPNYAWLQLVTAIEVAANRRQTSKLEPMVLLKELWPDCCQVLNSADEISREAIAAVLAPQVRATRKFIDFVEQCKPTPPDARPVWRTLDWENMGAHVKRVYEHRSSALHGGKPFPHPMLDEPRADRNGTFEEVPMGLNASALGAIWSAAETPMLLATFEYIARGALLNWWDEMVARVGVEKT